MREYSAYGEMCIGDKTLSKRVEKTLELLSSEPESSVLAACKDPHQAKGVYRLLSNNKFTTESVISISKQETIARIHESGVKVVLVPQDTTAIDYSGLKKTTGLGAISSCENSRGLMMHSAIAVGDDGRTFGLLAGKIWNRPKEAKGKKKLRKKLLIEDKESYKWLETIDTAKIFEEMDDVKVIHICDREGDIYELFSKAVAERMIFICRRTHSRIAQDENGERKYIDSHIEEMPLSGILDVNVPRDSHTKREARTARLEIKFGKIRIMKPTNLKKTSTLLEFVDVNVISAKEVNPPESVREPINWQLVTNDKVESFEDAELCICRYTKRWKIETFHYTLKSGCTIEKLQESTAEKLKKLIVLYSVIALRIMALTFLARTNPETSCEEEFSPDEWKILYRVVNKTTQTPEKPPTIFEAVIMIAKLGGFSARKSDGFPGVTVIWRGLSKLAAILDASYYIC